MSALHQKIKCRRRSQLLNFHPPISGYIERWLNDFLSLTHKLALAASAQHFLALHGDFLPWDQSLRAIKAPTEDLSERLPPPLRWLGECCVS